MTPLPLEVWFAAKVLILTKVPAPSLTSGLAFGKLVSFAIGTKPPTSSTKSTIRASIAPVVAIFVSPPLQVSPLAIVSVLSCLKYLASEPDVVKKLVSLSVAYACSALVTTAPVDSLALVIVAFAILSLVTLAFAILAVVTCASTKCWVSIDPST